MISKSTTYIRQLVSSLYNNWAPNDALLARAHGELLELEKEQNILVISPTIGHWTVPHSSLKGLLMATQERFTSEYRLNLVKGCGGKELISTTDYTTSFYSHVVVFE